MAMRDAPAGRVRPDEPDDPDELLRAYCADHQPDLLDRIVESFDWVAHVVAHRAKWHDESLDDLTQVARIGLLAAIERFDPTRGVAFRTFAEATMVGVLRHHHRGALTVRVPRGVQDLNAACHGAVERLAADLKRMPTSAEVAANVGADEVDVVNALAVDQLFHPMSLPASSGDDRNADLRERLGRIDALLDSADDRAEIHAALSSLPSRQRTILFLLFYEGWTQSEIGAHLGISQVQVSRLATQALGELRSRVQPLDNQRVSA